jgi:hypothetical protein
MNLSGRLLTSLAIALFAATVAHAGGERYRIDATLLHEGQPFAAPAMTVNGGEPATIEVAGAEAFKLAFTATGVDAETVRFEADLESAHGTMQPTMIVRTGEPASVTVGDLCVEVKVARVGMTDSP